MSKISYFTLLIFFSAVVFAQKGTLEGLITDAELSTPLNGAGINIASNRVHNSEVVRI